MSFGGHVLDMINRIKYNEALKNARRERYRKVKDTYLKTMTRSSSRFIDRKNLSDAQLRRLKRRIRIEIIREQRKDYIIALVITLILFGGIIYFVLSNLHQLY